MRLPRLAAVALLVAIVPATTAPATALASEAGYLTAQRDIQRSGYWGSHPNISDGEIVQIGYTACKYLVGGASEEAAVRLMLPESLAPAGTRQYQTALESVRDARRHVCP